ncbi:MAG: PhnD/SsuA/transferrin family substrate-binding protein, partial [Planctomycetes bacterium]|nr:PhnD/SsuA/transferrin family substrate-binding protein [Planctomycetota bacterium]
MCGCSKRPARPPSTRPAGPAGLRVVVMDPLAEKLTGSCMKDYGQRKYDELGKFLEGRLRRKVYLAYGDSLADILRLNGGGVDVIIGKESIVRSDASAAGIEVTALARLTSRSGATTTRGAFVVRADGSLRKLADLAGRKVIFGETEDREKHAAALAALRAEGVEPPEPLIINAADSAATLDVMDGAADAAVISDYA